MIAFVSEVPISPDLFRRAFTNSARRHPLLRAVIKSEDKNVWFDIKDEVSVDLEEESSSDWATVCKNIHANSSLDNSRLWYIKYLPMVKPEYTTVNYKYQTTLVLVMHHAIADGHSIKQMIKEIKTFVDSDLKGNIPETANPLSLPPTVETLLNIEYSLFFHGFIKIVNRLQGVYKANTQNNNNAHYDVTVKQFYPEEKKKASGNPGIMVIPYRLSKEKSSIFLEKCKLHSVAPTAVFTAATSLSFYKHFNISEAAYEFIVGLRNVFPTDDDAHNHVGLYSSIIQAKYNFPNKNPDLWNLAAECHQDIRDNLQSNCRRFLEKVNHIPVLYRHERPDLPLFIINNVGRFDEMTDNSLVQLGAVHGQAGNYYTLSICIENIREEITWTLNYNPEKIGDNTAKILADSVSDELLNIIN